jgi:hypothetical protein
MLMLMVGALTLQAQDRDRLVIIPFNPINVPFSAAEPVYADFEAALVRTETYSVVGREELAGVLENRGLGLFDCTSERSAVELAMAVSAGQMVRGELYSRDGRFFLKIKVYEVGSGRILYLDQLAARSLEQLRQSLELFVYRLAGLTVTSGTEEKIAQELGQVFVESIPPRADIYINGVKRGVSPDLIRRVPLGRVQIAAQLDLLQASRAVEVTRSLQQVRLELAERPGSLQFSAKGVEAYLDGVLLGTTGADSFTGLVPGVHSVELRGPGSYSRDDVTIRAGQQTLIEAKPLPYGSIEYAIPPGAFAEIRGESIREVVTGQGSLPVPVGNYSAAITGKDYEPREGLLLSVSQESAAVLHPDLRHSESYMFSEYSRQIQEAGRAIGFGYRLTPGDVQKLKDLRQAIAESGHEFPELLAQTDSMIERAEAIVATAGSVTATDTREAERQARQKRLSELQGRKQEIGLQIESRRLIRKRRGTGAWISFGSGLALGGLSILFKYLGDQAYWDYENAFLTPTEREQKKKDVQLFDASAIAALGASGICLVISSMFWLSSPPTRRLHLELNLVEQEIATLENQLR